MVRRNTPKARAALAKAFTVAQDYLWLGTFPRRDSRLRATLKARYICWALEYAAQDQQITWLEATDAKRVIMRRLAYKYTLGDWLTKKQGVPSLDLSDRALQAHRLAWLKLLAKEFSA